MSKKKEIVAEKFNNAITRYSMLDGIDSVLVGLSGGADSSLLLSLLSGIPKIKLYAAHMNHMIRGEEARRDLEFCKKLCKELDIPLFTCELDIPKLAKNEKCGIEETARKYRYEFFERMASQNGIDAIATAHNASDNLETVLFNLTRGCSPDGLCGIPPVRDKIIRPLILCTKEEILDACREYGIEYVTDSTNADTDYTRNYLRNIIVPELKRINPSLERAIGVFCESASIDKEHFKSLCVGYSLASGRAKLCGLDDSVLSRVLYSSLKEEGASPEHIHIRAIISALRSSSPAQRVSIPGAELIIDRDEIYLEERNASHVQIPCTKLVFGLNNAADGIGVLVSLSEEELLKDINKLKNIYNFSTYAAFDFDKINEDIFACARTGGERYFYGGISRSVKKLLQEKKLSAREKRSLPIITCGNEILWIPGFPVSDHFKPSEKSKKIYVAYLKNTDISDN